MREKDISTIMVSLFLLAMGFFLGLMASSFVQEVDAEATIGDAQWHRLLKCTVMSYAVDCDEPISRILKPRHMADILELPCTEEELSMLAKTVWGEARGCSDYEKGLVVWCVLNRLDMGCYGDSIKAVVTAPCQFFGYRESFPVDGDILELCGEIVTDWANGGENRTLPAQYVNFRGDGLHNHFFDRNGVYFN